MNIFEDILILILFFVLSLYVTSKLRKNDNISELINDIKTDLKETVINITHFSSKIKGIGLDDTLLTVLKYFIMNVEQHNNIAKSEDKPYLTGIDKKLLVISKLNDWLSHVMSSVDNANGFIEANQNKIESFIDDCILFSNRMNNKL